MKKLKIEFPIIVEGKYDKIKILSVADAFVITTDGFRLFKHNEKLSLLRELAKKTPIIVMTDSDGAGKLIRSHITSALPRDRVIQLYTPALKGKERRKDSPSAEGFLGVEGVDAKLIYDLLKPFDSDAGFDIGAREPITKLDFFEDGLSGGEGSAEKRRKLAMFCHLPPDMSANALLSALNILYSRDEYADIIGRFEQK